MTLKLALWISGLLGALALLAPGLVAVGLFLIVPGIVLMLAPTVFLYLATFAVIRMLVPLAPGIAANVTAGLVALGLGWLVVQPFAWTGARVFAAATLPDVVPAAPIALRGNIRIEAPNLPRARRATAPECSPLCAALLDTPDVERVTLVSTNEKTVTPPVTYRLVPRTANLQQSVLPAKPERILQELPVATGQRVAFASREADVAAVALGWAVRLATRDAIIVEPEAAEPTMTVRIISAKAKVDAPQVHRVEILDAAGTVVFRRSVVTHRVLSAPLHFTGVGGLENFRMVLARRELRDGPRYEELKPIAELFTHTTLARPRIDLAARDSLLQLLDAAVADASVPSTAPVFQLADAWYASTTWWKPMPVNEIDILARAIADPRVPITRAFYDGGAKHVAPALREAIGARIVHAETPDEVRTTLARLLANMPAGTFRTLNVNEREMLGRFALRKVTYPMIPRLADRGSDAVRDLLAILESDRQLRDHVVQRHIIEGVREALARLGPAAAAALPTVQPLLRDGASRLPGDYDDWNVALVRMGVPVDAIEFREMPPDRLARERDQLRQRVARFEKSLAER